MDNYEIYEDNVTRILRLCKDNFGDKFASYYEGDPIAIPLASLPAIIVEKSEGIITVSDSYTGFDNFNERITIRVVLDKESDFGASDNFDLTERRLRNYVEARDLTTGSYLKGTLMNIMRTHITLDEAIYNHDIEISYDINPRPNQVVTSEAAVTVSTRGRVPVPQRN